jgi:WD40 repeat protein
MNDNESDLADEQYEFLLAACDEALATGEVSAALSQAGTAPELQPGMERDLACIKLLRQWRGRDGPPAAPPIGALPVRLGRFEIRRELGRGGFGVVFLAFDPLLGREVALKVPRAGALVDGALRRRFQHEAQAAARLDHPNIVPVYDAGEAGPLCFIASAFCPGVTLAAWLQERTEPVCWREAAALVAALADGVQHAHSRGVLHRDLKPSNVLLVSGESAAPTTHNSPLTTQQPKITDFGLAKLLTAEAGVAASVVQTRSGAIVGTARYMAPEQAEGKTNEIGTAADVYALGAILYELITGRPVFEAQSDLAVLEQVRSQEPIAPRRHRPNLPRDVATICLKCLRKQPSHRYRSAAELAEDLQRLLAGEPIQARAVGLGERLMKWAKRRPAPAAVVSVTCLAATLLIFMSVAFNFQLTQEKGATNQALQREVQTNAELTRALYFHRINLAHHEWLANNVGRTEELLDACPPELRQWEWRYLKRLCQSGFATFLGHDDEVTGVAFDAKGKRVASASADGTIKVWDAETGQVLHTLRGHAGRVEDVAFSPDGQQMASAGYDQTVKVWDVATGNECYTLRGHDAEVACVAFSPDGQRLASASWDKTVKVWDAATGRLLHTLAEHPDRVFSVTFSPDGRRLATGSQDVRVWDATTGDLLGACTANPVEPLIWVGSVAFHPDGQRLASANGNKTVYIWDSTTWKALHVLRGHSSGVGSVRFSPDGERLASASYDQTVRLWDTARGAELQILRGHTALPVFSVAFAPDGQRLASGGGDKTVRVWDALAGQESLTIPGDQHDHVAWSADGRFIATAGSYDDRAVVVWDAHTGKLLRRLAGHTGLTFSVAFRPDSRYLASAGEDKSVKVWDTNTWEEVATLQDHSQPIYHVTYSPDGKQLASASDDETVKIWDPDTQQVIRTLQGHKGAVNSVKFSPDGKRLASASEDKTIRIWNAATGQLIRTLSGHSLGVNSVAFDPTGKHVATGSKDATVKVWNLATGQENFSFKGHAGSVLDTAFSPDGRRLASASDDYTVKLWDVASGHEALTLRPQLGSVSSVAFSPDGTRLLCGAVGMKIWESLPDAGR